MYFLMHFLYFFPIVDYNETRTSVIKVTVMFS